MQMHGLNELRARLREVEQKRNALLSERQNLEARRQSGDESQGVLERIARVNAGIASADARKVDLDAEIGQQSEQLAQLERIAQNPASREAAFDGMQSPAPTDRAVRDRDSGLRTIEAHTRDGRLESDAAGRLEGVLRRGDDSGLTARYLEAVGDPHYSTAFGKLLADPTSGHLRHTREETAAFQRVVAVQAEERAMSVGTTTAGGFAIPFALDPTIILSGSGARNPIRDVARVETVGTDVWKGVSSDGVTAAFAAEATEASDNTPTLAQPSATTQKAQAFIPYSIEVGQDWGTLQEELQRLLLDAKDECEATAFLTGTGTNEPQGLLIGATTNISSAGTAAFAVADAWSLKAAVPARFQPNATFAASPQIWDAAYRLVGTADPDEPLLFDFGRGGPFLGRPKIEISTMATSAASNAKGMVAGDFKHYLIADRIGASLEIVPHLFGSNRRPTGQRGAYFYWRVAGAVLAANAFRVLIVK